MSAAASGAVISGARIPKQASRRQAPQRFRHLTRSPHRDPLKAVIADHIGVAGLLPGRFHLGPGLLVAPRLLEDAMADRALVLLADAAHGLIIPQGGHP
jgi:hypothetical protein